MTASRTSRIREILTDICKVFLYTFLVGAGLLTAVIVVVSLSVGAFYGAAHLYGALQ